MKPQDIWDDESRRYEVDVTAAGRRFGTASGHKKHWALYFGITTLLKHLATVGIARETISRHYVAYTQMTNILKTHNKWEEPLS